MGGDSLSTFCGVFTIDVAIDFLNIAPQTPFISRLAVAFPHSVFCRPDHYSLLPSKSDMIFNFWLFSALTWWHIDTHRPLLENREWAPLEGGWQPEGQESDPLSGLLRHLLASGWPEWWWPCWPRVFLQVRTFSSLSPLQVCKHISSGGFQIYLVKIRAHVVSLNLWLEAFCLEEEDL